jgi:hypothetical protein
VAARRCHDGTRLSRSRVGVAVRQVVAAHGVAEVEPLRPDKKLSDGAVEPRDGVTGCTARANATD